MATDALLSHFEYLSHATIKENIILANEKAIAIHPLLSII